MSLETDLLLDRRRLKRRLFFWRVFAALAVLVVCLVAFVPHRLAGQHLARLNITGIITENRKLIEAVDAVAADDGIPGMVVFIDSPGGSVAGGESLHDAIARVAARKPVVAVMGGTAASAGYMVAMPAARVFARNATLTGSIGVILETGEVSGLLGHLGITATAVTSGPLKDQPSFTRPLTPQGAEYLHALVMDMYDQFVAMVATGRHLDPDRVRALADGRAYTGRQALPLGLIDQIGDERDARDWLAASRGISATLPIRDVSTATLSERAFGAILGTQSLTALKMLFSQGVMLDGAWALWQPAQQ